MTEQTTQPPPVLVPVQMQKEPSTTAYLQTQKDALYHLWVEVQRLANLNPPGSDFVDAVNDPVALDIARFTDSNSIEGLSYSELRDALSVIVFPRPYAAKSTDYTLTSSDYLIKATTTGITITLPTAVGIEGKDFVIKNTASGDITLATDGSETIDGSASAAIVTFSSLTVASDGANWIIV